MRTRAEIRLVEQLAEQGLPPAAIAAQTRVPYGTVRRWARGEVPRGRAAGCPRCGTTHDLATLPPDEYAYLLGQYLGDGCILAGPRGVFRLEIAADSRYPNLIRECARAMKAVVPGNVVSLQQREKHGRCTIIRAYSKSWPCLFPQHGPGHKHERRIALEPWQERIVDEHPERFVRGLIHSDGCRVLNRVNGKDYPRYFFSQVSDDIRRLFCRSLRQLRVDYTWNDARNVSIARAASVARLDEFVGPKS